MTTPVIIDTDPGLDDAMAILMALASPALDVVGLTTIFGNHDTDTTTRNAQQLLRVGGRDDIPIGRGAERPLAMDYIGPAVHVHGHDGQGNIGWEACATTHCDESASALIERMAARHHNLVLIALGPLTNLAELIRAGSPVVERIREVIIMGGTLDAPGNVTPAAEANIIHDPEAADIVLSAPWRTAMIGLDVTSVAVMEMAQLRRLMGADTPASRHLKAALPFYIDLYRERGGLAGARMHDPATIVYALEPSLFDAHATPLVVELEGDARGRTRRDVGSDRPSVRVPLTVDVQPVLNMIEALITKR